MAKPYRHAQSSARKWGGVPEDYTDIHDFLDCSKGAIPDNRHRALTHTSWFLSNVLEKVFGITRRNSDGKIYCVRDIGEQHVLEDFGMKFIPTAQDYLQGIPYQDWMQNGHRGHPPSAEELMKHGRAGRIGSREAAEGDSDGRQGEAARDSEHTEVCDGGASTELRTDGEGGTVRQVS